MTAPTLALVETDKAETSGHWYQVAACLGAHGRTHGRRTLLIVPAGISAQARQGMDDAGIEVVTAPRGITAVLPWRAGRALRRAATVLTRHTRHRRFPHQWMLLARCLGEAGAVRTATALAGADRVVVLLSAAEGLHTLAAALGGPHLRTVHEVYTTEDRLLRGLSALTRRASHRILAIAPTPAVQEQIVAKYPRLHVVTRPFALADAEPPIEESEHATARDTLGLAASEVVVSVVGGWWKHKDPHTLRDALALVQRPLRVLVAGSHIDEQLLHDIAALPNVRVEARIGHLTRADIRQVYAASDATIVARHPGAAKESGLICDAAVLRIPLIVSDHDPSTTQALTGQPWARVFPAEDPAALSIALDALHTRRLPRPGSGATVALGLRDTAAALADYLSLHAQLAARPQRRRRPWTCR